jgi:hypothetical protein
LPWRRRQAVARARRTACPREEDEGGAHTLVREERGRPGGLAEGHWVKGKLATRRFRKKFDMGIFLTPFRLCKYFRKMKYVRP